MLRWLAILLLHSSFAHGEDVLDLAAKYNSAQKGVVKLETRKRQVLADIYAIEKETNKLVLQKTELGDKKLKLDGRLAEISKKIVEMEVQVREMIPDLVERLNFTDQVNSLPWFYTFLTSQSLNELDVTFEAAKQINKQQGDQLLTFVSLVEEMEDKKRELKKTALEIVQLQKSLKVKESAISSNQLNKKKILKNLERRLIAEKKSLKVIKGRGKRALKTSFFKDLDMLFGSSFFDKKGKLPEPIHRPVFHTYGLNQALLKDRVHLVHKGYFYQTFDSQPVTSVADGRIRFAGQVEGYGKVIVIDHGSRYYTVYANLNKLVGKRGQEVKPGQFIGETGFDHLQFGSGLYFEIRHFSQPQNPADWLQTKNEALANL